MSVMTIYENDVCIQICQFLGSVCMFLLKEISEKKKEKFYPQQIFNEVLALMMVYIHALMTKMAIRTCFINVIALVHKA